MVTPNSKKSERPPHPNRLPRKRATIADMAPEEVYYRPLKPPCPWCGQTNTKFRYFNNRYRTPGTRISSYDQPRFKCLSPCNLEFILGRKNEKKQKTKTKNGDIIVPPTCNPNPSASTNDGNCARTIMTNIYMYVINC